MSRAHATLGAVALLGSLAATPARAQIDPLEGVSRGPRAAPDLPLDLLDVEGRTAFRLTTRWTPASAAHVWHLDANAAFGVTPGLAVTLGVPVAILAPQRGDDDRFAMGNIHLGVAGGTALTLVSRREAEDQGLSFRFGGAFDTYFPTAPIPDDERLTALAALHYRPLEPGLWAARALGFRARAHVGLTGAAWSVDGEVGFTPAFTLESDSDAWLWFTAALRARVVLAEVIEPFVELGGTVTAASPTRPLLTNVFDAGGFQITPGVRFHLGGFSPAVFVALRPSDEGGNATIGVDIAGAVQRSPRSTERDMLDGL